jgi:organic hydroperoxide reductase OsmC/OhrA
VQDLPHHYVAVATVTPEAYAELTSPGLVALESAGPPEFGGPGDLWSPETLLAAAVADCFVLSFKAIARASRFEWLEIGCAVEAKLERIEKVTKFTQLVERVTLRLPAGSNEDKARRLLEKAEHACLITNSMTAETRLEIELQIAA